MLPVPQHCCIPGMDHWAEVSWCYWAHWGEKKRQKSDEQGQKGKEKWSVFSSKHRPLWLSLATSASVCWPRAFTATSVQLPSHRSKVHTFSLCVPPVYLLQTGTRQMKCAKRVKKHFNITESRWNLIALETHSDLLLRKQTQTRS